MSVTGLPLSLIAAVSLYNVWVSVSVQKGLSGPGGPQSRTPRGILAPERLKRCGFRKKSTTSISSSCVTGRHGMMKGDSARLFQGAKKPECWFSHLPEALWQLQDSSNVPMATCTSLRQLRDFPSLTVPMVAIYSGKGPAQHWHCLKRRSPASFLRDPTRQDKGGMSEANSDQEAEPTP